jgi:branched-chain amino acid transport system substrate-binding protein
LATTLLAAALALAWLGAPAALAGSQENPVVVGGSIGLTGPFSGPSAVYKVAYDFWLNRVNKEGGLLGRPVKMIIYDDEGKPPVAQALYQRLIKEDKVDLVLAPFSTFIGGAIIPVVEANNKVLWNGGFVGIELFKKSRWIVGSYSYQEPDYPRGVFELIESLAPADRPKRLGIVTAQNPFPLIVRDGFQGYGGVLGFAKRLGIPIGMSEEYAQNATDVSGLIQRAKAANVDAFFALSLPNDAALFARTAHELRFKPKLYCACGSQVTTLPFWKDLGPAGEGIISTAMGWPTDRYKDIDALLNELRTRLNYREVPAHATAALAILQVLEQAVKESGTLDQAKLRAHVTGPGRKFATATGVLEYDRDGIPAYNAVVVQFQGGRNEVVWPPQRATGRAVLPMR